MKITKIMMVIFVAVGLLLASTSTAVAQDNDSSSDEELVLAGLSASLLTTTGITTTSIGLPVGIVITVVLIANSSNNRAVLEEYMRDNAVAIQHDLYMGGGDSARDLAVLFNVPDEEFGEFAALLSENRSRLVPLVAPEAINAEGARAFSTIIVTEMLRHDSLRLRFQEQLG